MQGSASSLLETWHSKFRRAVFLLQGELIRQILYPKRQAFQFYRDALFFIAALVLACLGFLAWSAWKFATAGATPFTVAVRVLDLITVIVPPALPIAVTAGTSFAIARLKGAGVFCVVPRAVALAGRVNLVCFDKTGTLTADHLAVAAVVPVMERSCGAPVPVAAQLQQSPGSLMHVLAACHSVAQLERELVGDPMEIKMLQWTGWTLSPFDQEETTITSMDRKQVIKIIKRHDFSAMQACMSVVAVGPDGARMVYCKGAPKLVVSHCSAGVPANLEPTINQYTAMGMRVIALASRALGSTNADDRAAAESGLAFQGLLVLRNPIKQESFEIVAQLRSAKIETVMITGDSPLTAISVASALNMGSNNRYVLVEGDGTMCEVSPHGMTAPRPLSWNEIHSQDWDVALTGAAYEQIRHWKTAELAAVLIRTRVFARANPLHKMDIVQAYKRIGFTGTLSYRDLFMLLFFHGWSLAD